MSNGYLLAAEADLGSVRELAAGFGLEAICANTLGSQAATVSALSDAANVGIVLSHAATRDAALVSLLHALATSLHGAQLILATPDARDAFGFLPASWPMMALDEARTRAAELVRRRAEHEASGGEAPRAHPLPQTERAPAPEPPPAQAEPAPPAEDEAEAPPVAAAPSEDAAPSAEVQPPAPTEEQAPPATLDSRYGDMRDAMGAGGEAPSDDADKTDGVEAPPAQAAEPPALATPMPAPTAPPSVLPPGTTLSAPNDGPRPPLGDVGAAAPGSVTPEPQSVQPPRQRARNGGSATAPADATAFAPKKLRRGSPELVRIVIHQPKDLQAVIKAARKVDARTEPAPSGMKIGDVELGASVGVALEVRGAVCDGTLQRRTWEGAPLDFNFSAEAETDVKQAVFLARVFVNDAQIGVLAFTRPVGGPHKKPHSTGERVRLKRHKRVFLSYSSKDRETVAAIATAYQAAGVAHFFDRTSLKSGEEWSPRLRREIDRADLFHLCWSRSAAASEWVEKEATHALTRRRRAKRPDITVQMLDGPPWAPHPPELDSINFDDFVRAAIVGYARGDGSS
jgi:hypothetical protein